MHIKTNTALNNKGLIKLGFSVFCFVIEFSNYVIKN